MTERRAGILLPITALPSPYGVGTLGKAAENFVDFLAKAGQKVWQVLPLVPTGYGDSPYASSCATAGSPYLIDVEKLEREGLVTKAECAQYTCETGGRVDYEALFYKRIPLLRLAFSRFDKTREDFRAFLEKGDFADFSLFMALKVYHGHRALSAWEEKYRKREERALADFRKENAEEILFWQFTQFEFFKQWEQLKSYANAKGIEIMGDMPLYVSEDSAEVWARPELFMLDENGFPAEVAGVPPDYFSEDGQLWGNPLYNWEKMKEDGYAWWTARLKKAFAMYDFVRIDHFRGFDRFYAVKAGSTDARNGRWYDGPKEELFADKKDWGIIAEDLGLLDDGVIRLMRNTGYPRMKILEFAFDGNPDHEYKPSNYGENSVVYTGTHDNATFIEYLEDMPNSQRKIFYADLKKECEKGGVKFRYYGCEYGARPVMERARKAVIELAYKSRAKFVIFPLQDVLGTGRESHMNRPGTLGTWNWSWRVCDEMLTDSLAKELSGLIKEANRE